MTSDSKTKEEVDPTLIFPTKHVQNDANIFNQNPMCIVISDLHLGAIGCYSFHLIAFLDKIIQKKKTQALSNLKAIIITGDVFDVINDSVKDLMDKRGTNYIIFEKLNEIHNLEIKIIMTLGNHEISLFGRFRIKKEKLLEKIRNQVKKYDYSLDFLVDAQIGQYAVLEKRAKEWVISFYDNMRSLRKFWKEQNGKLNQKQNGKSKSSKFCSLSNPIILGTVVDEDINPPTYKKVFITHGHQYIYAFSLFCGFVMWSPLMRSPDFAKEFINLLWNFWKVRPDTGNTIIEDYSNTEIQTILDEWEGPLTNEEYAKIVRDFEKRRKFVKFLLWLNKKITPHSGDRKGKLFERKHCNNGIKKFHRKHTELGIDLYLYGHSHDIHTKPQTETTPTITNSGGWQDVNAPGFIEFYNSGTYEMFYYSPPLESLKEYIMGNDDDKLRKLSKYQKLISPMDSNSNSLKSDKNQTIKI